MATWALIYLYRTINIPAFLDNLIVFHKDNSDSRPVHHASLRFPCEPDLLKGNTPRAHVILHTDTLYGAHDSAYEGDLSFINPFAPPDFSSVFLPWDTVQQFLTDTSGKHKGKPLSLDLAKSFGGMTPSNPLSKNEVQDVYQSYGRIQALFLYYRESIMPNLPNLTKLIASILEYERTSLEFPVLGKYKDASGTKIRGPITQGEYEIRDIINAPASRPFGQQKLNDYIIRELNMLNIPSITQRAAKKIKCWEEFDRLMSLKFSYGNI